MTLDREALLSLISMEGFSESVLQQLRSSYSTKDDGDFLKGVAELLSRPINIDAVAFETLMTIQAVIDENFRIYEDNPQEDELCRIILEKVKGRFSYVNLLIDMGREDLASDVMKGIADSMSHARDIEPSGAYHVYLRFIEDDIRSCIESESPSEWFRDVSPDSP